MCLLFCAQAWRHFVDDAISCLSAPGFESLVVDVMQNGGGYVCLGLRLLTLIFTRFDLDHSQVRGAPSRVLSATISPHAVLFVGKHCCFCMSAAHAFEMRASTVHRAGFDEVRPAA